MNSSKKRIQEGLAISRGLVSLALDITLVPEASVVSAKDPIPKSNGELEYRFEGEQIGQEQFRVYRGKRLVIETKQLPHASLRHRDQRHLGHDVC
jgi:hypothetical protein